MIARAVVLALALAAAGTAAQAEPNKEQYELQERCGKQAAELFKADHPTGREAGTATVQNKDSTDIVTYENHYSASLNRCFYLQITSTFKRGEANSITIMNLFDLNENKQYGTFFGAPDRPPLQCEVKNARCHSESEWRELLKPYMEQ